MKTFLLHVLLPLLVLAGAGGVAWWLIATRKPMPVQVPVVQPPLVRTVAATPQSLQLMVASQGTVAARTVTTLAAEVAGRVLAVAPTLRDGAFFAANDELVRIDPVEHEAAVAQAKAEVARAERVVQWERAEAAAAVAEWQKLNGGAPPPLVAHELQVAEAAAVLQAAQAAVARTGHALANCVVKAPYAGRVLHASVHVGDFVARGTVLGKVHALDAVEVALPLPDAELQFLDLPQKPGDGPGPAVRLRAEFGGTAASWTGRIVRTAGEVDQKSRMVHAIVEVDAPFAGATPLVPGMFVLAEVDGHRVDGVMVLPREALRLADHLFVVDGDVLRWQKVDVLRAERSRVVVRGGLAAGAQVVVQDLEAPTDGMRVRTAAAEGGR